MVEDGVLLQRFVATGDRSAFAELWTRYQNLLFTIAMRITNDADDAAEILQDSCLQVMKSAHTYEGRAPLKYWLVKIVEHQALQQCRQRKRKAQLEQEFGKAKEGRAADTAGSDAALEAIKPVLEQGISELDPELRTAVILHFYDKMPQTEIAECLGCSQGAIFKRLEKAKEILRRFLVRTSGAESGAFLLVGLESAALLQIHPELALQLGHTITTAATIGTGSSLATTAAVIKSTEVLGGMIVTTKLLATMSACIAVVCLGLGFYSGRVGMQPSTPLLLESSTKDVKAGANVEDGAAVVTGSADDSAINIQNENALRAENTNMRAEIARLTENRSDLLEKLAVAEAKVVDVGHATATANASNPRSVAVLRSALKNAIESGKGKDALAILAELSTYGEDHYGEVIEGYILLKAGKAEMGLQANDIAKALQSQVDVMLFGLDPEIDSSFRSLAATTLRGMGDSRFLDRYFSDIALKEHDYTIMEAAMYALREDNNPKYYDNLLAIIETRHGDGIIPDWHFTNFALNIARSTDPESEKYFRRLEVTTNPSVKHLMDQLYLVRQPPIAGLLLLNTGKESDAYKNGLRPSDIILSYGGDKAASQEALLELSKHFKPEDKIVVTVYRNGSTLNLNVDGGTAVWHYYHVGLMWIEPR